MQRYVVLVLVIVVALAPVVLAEMVAPKERITKDSGIYVYQGETRGEVRFDHKLHQQSLSCDTCHEGNDTPDVTTMSGGHGLCQSCHNEMGMGECTVCHAK